MNKQELWYTILLGKGGKEPFQENSPLLLSWEGLCVPGLPYLEWLNALGCITTQNTNEVQSVHINLQWIGNLAKARTYPVEILLGGRISCSLKQLQQCGFRWLCDTEVTVRL